MELATLRKVTLADFPATGRGLACNSAVREGEAFLEVPLDSCFTLAKARAAPELAGLDRVRDRDLLCLHLMLEAGRGEESWTGGYLSQLPSLEDMGLPWGWTEEERAELEGSEVAGHCANVAREIPEDWAELQAAVEASGAPSSLLEEIGATAEGYAWARSIQWSRYMSLRPSSGEGEAILALVPGLDMANHSPEVPAGLFRLDSSRRVVVARAAKDYAEGEQVMINYRQGATNSQLLMSFGFALPSRSLYACEVTFSLQV